MPPEITGVDLALFGDGGTDRTAVRIGTDAGATGAFAADADAFHPAERCAPHLVGRNPLARERHWTECRRRLRQSRLHGLGLLDAALWDLAGRHHDAPVHALLGTYRERLPAYLSVGIKERHRAPDLPERLADAAAAARDAGYPGVKIRFSRDSVRGPDEGDPRATVERVVDAVHAVGERVGDDVACMLDTTTELETYANALAVGRACDEQDFFWFEDPFMDGANAQHANRTLREAIDTPLLVTELVHGVETHTDFAAGDATDFLRADPYYHGGVTGARKIARAAEGFGLDVEFHGRGAAARHCMAATRNTNFYEINGPLDAVDDHLDAVDDAGTVPAPSDPGLGVDLDWDAIRDRAVLTRRYE